MDLLKRSVRSVICPHCIKRPQQSETFGPNVPRQCEPECTIFANLPKLAKIAHDAAGMQCPPIEHQMLEQICLNCHADPLAGPECMRRLERECPLSVYLLEVMEPLERVLESRAPVSRQHVHSH
jgi:hypothetical protein